ncbi:MAG: DNA repair protein RecO [Thermovirgaceae bacterium]
MEGKSRQGLIRERGVILRRVDSPEGNRSVYVFLSRYGPVWTSAPGAARGKARFGGSTEPMVWGIMHLYRGPNRFYLRDVDVKKDFWSLRNQPERMRRAIGWIHTVSLGLLPMHPCDELLPVLYWSLCSLEDESVPPFAVEWRFFWKWLRIWGLAPDLCRCSGCSARDSKTWVLSDDGLYCRDCASSREGVHLLPKDVEDLQKAVALPRKAFLEWARQAVTDERTWNLCNELVKKGILSGT